MGSFNFFHVIILMLIALIMAIYVTPSVIAHRRNHPSRNAIIAVNILLGWSIVGWAFALIWAFKRP